MRYENMTYCTTWGCHHHHCARKLTLIDRLLIKLFGKYIRVLTARFTCIDYKPSKKRKGA